MATLRGLRGATKFYGLNSSQFKHALRGDVASGSTYALVSALPYITINLAEN
jgi:hypothetical protein